MSGPAEILDCIVLKSVDYGEADRVFTFLSRASGKVTAFASGARKSQKRFGPAVDLFAHVRAELRASARSPGALRRLSSAEIVDPHFGIRLDLARFAQASYLAECLLLLVAEGDPHPELFDWWRRSLASLADLSAPFEPSVRLDLELLKLCGYSPRWARCTECGGLPAGEKFFFSFERGGVTCAACRKSGDGKWLEPEMVRRLSGEEEVSGAHREPLRRVVEAFFSYTLGKEPRSQRFRSEVWRGRMS